MEREAFDGLFRLLPSDDDRSDFLMLLERLKAKGVPLRELPDVLLAQWALDAHGSRAAVIRHRLSDFAHDVTAFQRAARALIRKADLLEAPALGVRPPVFRHLLEALIRATGQAGDRSRGLRGLLAVRASKRRPRRELVGLPPGIARDDQRELLRFVALMAANSDPSAGVSIQYGFPPACGECANPAPYLFRPGVR